MLMLLMLKGMRREISRTKKMSEEETLLGIAADHRPDAIA